MRAPLVKLCGLRTPADVSAAVAAGADAVGFVLCASARRVTRAEASRLLSLVPREILSVAVMGPLTPDLLAVASSLPFGALQCELEDAPLPRLGGGRLILPSFRDSHDVAERIGAFWRREAATLTSEPGPFAGAYVLDGPRGGGRGRAPDADRARQLALTKRLVLAGGLDPENVGARVRASRPYAVDVSSGIESARGRKDPSLMQAFVRNAREAFRPPRADVHGSIENRSTP